MKLYAIRKGDVTYLSESLSTPSVRHTYTVNGSPVSTTLNGKWLKVSNTNVASLVRLVPGKSNIVKYKLIEGISASERFPHEVSSSEYWSLQESITGCYEPVYEKSDDTYESVEVELIDGDCEPVEIKYPYKSKFPYDVDYYNIQKHKFPCYIDSDAVYKHVVSQIKHLAEQDKRLRITEYESLRHIMVNLDVELLRAEPYQEKVQRGKRTVMVDKLRRSYRVKLLDLGALSSQYGEKRVPKFEADNYVELERKVDAYIDETLSVLRNAGGYVCCPNCNGYGVVEQGGTQR